MTLAHGVSQEGLGQQLFGRRCRLLVAQPLVDEYKRKSDQVTEIVDLRMTFKITKDTSSKPNTSEITVYNLSEQSRAGMQAKGARIILQAGYESTLATIFVGDARIIDHRHDGPNWVTKIEAGDGERAYANARVSESIKGQVRGGTALLRVVEAMGLGTGNLRQYLDEINASFSFENGWTVHGRAAPELTRVLEAIGFEWSVQDGELQVVRAGDAVNEIVVLSADYGLIGSPEHGTAEKSGKPAVIKIRSLLQPRLRAGGKVKLESRSHAGTYKIRKLEHVGDTEGGEWYSNMEAVIDHG